jgi:hypothetical protein
MVEVELGAAQQQQHLQQHYSASEAILIYNQQLHADQSANAIAGETSSSADGALTAGAAHIQSNCRPVRVSRAQKRVCSFVQAGVLGMRVAENSLSLSCMHATNVPTADPSNSASAAHGVEEIPTACNFLGFGQQPSASVRAVDADGRYRPCSLLQVSKKCNAAQARPTSSCDSAAAAEKAEASSTH